MINFLRTLLTLIICYSTIAIIELIICYYTGFDPNIFLLGFVIVINLFPVTFLTDYLLKDWIMYYKGFEIHPDIFEGYSILKDNTFIFSVKSIKLAKKFIDNLLNKLD